MPSADEPPKTTARARPELFPRTAWTDLCLAERSSTAELDDEVRHLIQLLGDR